MNEKDLYVIGKSVSCSNRINEIEKATKKLVTSCVSLGALAGFLIISASTVIELLNGEKLEYIKGPSLLELMCPPSSRQTKKQKNLQIE